jgi:hypothetical protein
MEQRLAEWQSKHLEENILMYLFTFIERDIEHLQDQKTLSDIVY